LSAAVPGAIALIAWLAEPSAALAQDNVVATATLPRDLSPWGMYLNADPVVKALPWLRSLPGRCGSPKP